LETKKLRYKPLEKCIIFVCLILVVFGGLTSFCPGIYRIIVGKEPYIVYPGFKAPLSGIVEIACDPSGNLYVLADHSDCIVVFSPEGDVRYSYFFESTSHGSHEMVVMKDGTVLVDLSYFGVDIFNDEGLFKKIVSEGGLYSIEIDQNDIFVKGDLETGNMNGDVFKANPITSQISKTDRHGDTSHFTGDSFPYWMLNELIPGWAMIGIGAIGIFYTREKMRKRFKETIEYDELMKGRNR
jgi:hypothetical protein